MRLRVCCLLFVAVCIFSVSICAERTVVKGFTTAAQSQAAPSAAVPVNTVIECALLWYAMPRPPNLGLVVGDDGVPRDTRPRLQRLMNSLSK